MPAYDGSVPLGVAFLVASAMFAGDGHGPASQDYNARFNAWLKTPSEAAKVAPKPVTRDYSWLDATPAITKRGGVRYRDPSVTPWRFSISATLDEARAQSIERHFGAPLEDIQFSFTSPEEKAKCQRLEDRKLAHHGMRVVSSSDGSFGKLEVDFQWLVDGCRREVAPIAASILKETDRVLKESHAPRVATQRDKVAAIFRFIQSIPYEPVGDLPDGKDRCGMRAPLTTLLKGGDCDSKSALMAAFIRSRAIADTVIVTLKARDGTGHALVGVRVEAQTGDETVTHDGLVFVLAEAAAEDRLHDGNLTDLGEIGDAWKDFRTRAYEVTPIR
ncbi:MAG: hypothetical protein EXS03_02145 [Phycisphaerales bacterium]|nr:hypothetical protein [Phycisphaerales bacterium]